jgi:sugar phosphate isomerase/epimerase
MNRRDFLTGTAAGAAALAGAGLSGFAQGGAPPAGGRQGAPAGRGRGNSPAPVGAEKLARVSIMTLCFNSILREPWAQNPTPEETLTIFDLPQMYVDTYGVHNIEYQHSHLAPGDPKLGPIDGDPAMFKELKAKLDAAKVRMTQINLEFGLEQSISGPPEGRKLAVERTKKWIDNAVMLGCPRVMINQQQAQLNKENRAAAVTAWKEMADYGRTRKVTVSAETRGAGTPELAAQLAMKPWQFLAGIIKEAGASSNVDWGNVGAQNQQELHDCIKAWHASNAGSMHVKSSPFWDIGTGVRFTESIGYKGLYSIEVGTHPAVRIVYNTILANLA